MSREEIIGRLRENEVDLRQRGVAHAAANIAGRFDGPVDVVSREGLKPYLKPAATSDAIYAF